MKPTLPLIGALALSFVALGAQAQPMGPAPMGPAQMAPRPMHPGMRSDGAIATPDYVRTAAQSDEFEIAEAKLALRRSHDPKIEMFARKMIHDHTQSTDMIKAALTQSGHMVPPPPPLSGMQEQMISQLRASGPDFDKTYIDQQLQAHHMALATHQAYAQTGTDPTLRHTAEKIVPVVESHLKMLDDMQGHMG
jgi:putative membrane protein